MLAATPVSVGTPNAMKVAVIAALAKNRVIGANNTLPWRLPADMAKFKQLTVGRACVQGRKTFESIGRPLPNRLNIIVSRDPEFKASGCLVAGSLPAALDTARDAPDGAVAQRDTIFVCGGAALYAEAIPMADILYLTHVDAEVDGDAWFPEFDESQWEVVSKELHKKDEKNAYDFTFVTYARKDRLDN